MNKIYQTQSTIQSTIQSKYRGHRKISLPFKTYEFYQLDPLEQWGLQETYRIKNVIHFIRKTTPLKRII